MDGHIVIRDGWHDAPSRPQIAAGKPVATARRLAVRARYDAAVTSEENRRHWAQADAMSANAANSPEVRRQLRMRARYEVANNSYARGIVSTLANDLIGTGPRLQLLTDDIEANRRIELAWHRWSRRVNLADKLRTMRMARATDGEAFALFTSNPVVDSEVTLDLRLIEAEQVATPDLSVLDPLAIDGIVFDPYGNPAAYHVLRSHPGDTHGLGSLEYRIVPARSVLHWFRADRPGQARGIPDITPALPLFAQLRRYTLAVITAAETAANIAGVLYTDAPASGESENAEPFESIELERGGLLTMPGGWKMNQLQAEQPTTTYGEFKREILNEIARCLNMPFNVAAGNSSSYNYSSGRLDHQTYFKALRVEQSLAELVILDRLLDAWLDEAILVPGLIPAGIGPVTDWPHKWFWDGSEHVDPEKEARAQETRLRTFTTTLADEYASRGLDWETQLHQRAKELDLMRDLGLAPDDSGTDTADPTEAVDDGEEEAGD
jgi:lambda family phage portal protein